MQFVQARSIFARGLGLAALMLLLASPFGSPFGSPAGAAGGATITVDQGTDVVSAVDGHCTLPEAITAANTNTASGGAAGECAAGMTGVDHIVVNPAVTAITVTANLPAISAPVVVDGGSGKTRLAAGGTADTGLDFAPGSKGSTLTGFKVTGFSNAGVLLAGGGVTLTNNYIGTPDGTSYAANGDGIRIQSASNIIGKAGHGNVIGANQNGIRVSSGSGSLIQGNFVGVTSNGSSGLANTTGIWLDTASSKTTIGGSKAGQGNVISANATGIEIQAGVKSTLIMRNYLGTNSFGDIGLSNLSGIVDLGGVGTTVGGAMPASSNLFGNNLYGIQVAGAAATNSITISGNIFGLGSDGVSALAGGRSIYVSGVEKTTIKNNLLANATSHAIEFDPSSGNPQAGVSTLNCIYGNATGAEDTSGTAISLGKNWWGKATGPNTAGADTTIGPVTTAGFLTVPPASCLGWAAVKPKPSEGSFAAKSTKPTKLSWGAVPTASDYVFELYKYNDYTSSKLTLISPISTGGAAFFNAGLLDYGRYYWTTRTQNAEHADWPSAVHMFYVTNMKSPKPGAVVKAGAIKFSWGVTNPPPGTDPDAYTWSLYSTANCFYDTTNTNLITFDSTIQGLTTTKTISTPGQYWWAIGADVGPQMDCWPITVKP